jgi:hypothetical protein
VVRFLRAECIITQADDSSTAVTIEPPVTAGLRLHARTPPGTLCGHTLRRCNRLLHSKSFVRYDASMNFQFTNYDIGELRECARAFMSKFAHEHGLSSTEWTSRVREWFSDAKPIGDSITVYARRGNGEFMVDLCHLTYPRDRFPKPHERMKRWSAVFETEHFAIKLAMECEWISNYAEILDDASKLALLRADIKVMIFSSKGGVCGDCESIMNKLAQLRRAARDGDPWLCIDVPYEGTTTRNIRCKIFPDGEWIEPNGHSQT